ncbi:MAG TPA: universal stress protein [Flavobacteriales bacterium]|jgi:nucleotide-binding universal stress UspA family protein|nr:universal stress protein [Flavobacteriales bacterium]
MSGTMKRILVPTDFTKVADCAMNHAASLAERAEGEIHLLHIVDRASDVEEARTKLAMEVERVKRWSPRAKVHPLVRVGSVYEDIGTAAAEVGANLIIMGTHGMRGMQFITGSRALRVITNSSVPFIVVQERNIKADGYRDIVVPLDLHKETRQKIALVADMAKYFNSKVHVITPKESDEFLHHQLENHIRFAKQYFGERSIELEATIADVDSGDFVDAVIKYAMKVDADLLAIMNLAQGNIFGVLGVPYEQEIITNEAMVPVMLMNPRETGTGGGWTFQ